MSVDGPTEDPTSGTPSPAPATQLARLLDGYLTTQLLYVAADLGIADALAGGPQDAAAVAVATGVSPAALWRILRGLAAEGVLDEDAAGRFGLTALGACLRADAPDSLRGVALARGAVYFPAAARLLDAVREGGVAFERAHGTDFFEYLARHPARGAAFQASMTDRARQETAAVLAAYDFGHFTRLVDVGGGEGIMLAAILAATPRLRGVLFDRPAVVAAGAARLAAAGLDARVECVPGDFFAGIPSGAGAYLLSRVLHDWDDDDARRILATCHRAMDDGATLLLVETLLPALARDAPAAIRMDLHMLLLLGGRERTEAELNRLLASAGFRVVRVVPTASPAGVCVVEAIRVERPEEVRA
jgi:hypothetical protein